MKELLQEYKKTLRLTNRELNGGWKERKLKDPESYLNMLSAAKSDLEFAIKWLKKGFQPDAHWRGIERNDAYYVMRPYDPVIIERYMENRQANVAFEFIEGAYRSIEEMQEQKRIEFEDSLSKEKLCAIRKAKKVLDEFEMQVVLLSEQGRSVREIAEMLGVSHMKIQRTKNKCRAVFEEILLSSKRFKGDERKTFICHCDVSANDSSGHITAKPTLGVKAFDKSEAVMEAIKELEEKYTLLGCNYVNVSVVLINEG